MEARVCQFQRYLPAYVQDVMQDEAAYKMGNIMRILDQEVPAPSDLSFALRSLKSYDEQQPEFDVERCGNIFLRLWELFSTTRYSYVVQTRILDLLASLLHRLFQDVPKKWMGVNETEPEILTRVRARLDAKVVVYAFKRELFASPRIDTGDNDSRCLDFMSALVNYAAAIGRYQSSTNRDLMDQLLIPMARETSHQHMILWCRLLVLLTPRSMTKSIIASRELFDWWNLLPEGLVPRFDVLWFTFLARYAKISWLEGADPACQAVMQEWNHSLFNKLFRQMDFPLLAPTEATLRNPSLNTAPWHVKKHQIHSEFECFFSSEIQSQQIGTWIVYSLEPDTSGQMWTLLLKLVHRMRPFMMPINFSSDGNTWTVIMFAHIYSLCQCYYQRAARERAFHATPQSRLTEECDKLFVETMVPLVQDGLHQDNNSLHLLLSLCLLGRLASPHVQWSNDASMSNAFMKGVETLSDPLQSSRHAHLLQRNALLAPVILRFYPSMLPDMLSLSLFGIDSTDLWKTLSALAQVVSVFSIIPCMDLGDLDNDDFAPNDNLSQAWIYARGPESTQNDDEILNASSTLPAFAAAFFEKILAFIPSISKPEKIDSLLRRQLPDINLFASTLISMSTVLIASQVSTSTAMVLTELVSSWILSSAYLAGKKTAKSFVTSVVRAIPASIDTLVPSLAQKVLKGSEHEVVWYLEMLCGCVRYVGAEVMKHRAQLEQVMRFCLSSSKKEKQKLGAKLIRTILSTLTSTYIINDFRSVPAATFQKLSKNHGVNLWMGETWWKDHKLDIDWHVPNHDEIAWAEELAAIVVDDLLVLLGTKAVRGVSQPYTPCGICGDGAIVSDSMRALFLLKALMRGGATRWPDQRCGGRRVCTQPPGGQIPDHFTSVGEALLVRMQACEAEDVPKHTRKILQCLRELMHGKIPITTGALLPHVRQDPLSASANEVLASKFFDKCMLSQMYATTVHSEWCDLPRLSWVLAVLDTQDRRNVERTKGYAFTGLRKKLLLSAVRISTYSSFSEVRLQAQNVTFVALRKHYGGKCGIGEDFVGPAMDTLNAKLGAADASVMDPSLNSTITGLSYLVNGALHGTAIYGWRQGPTQCASLVMKALKTYYFATKPSSVVIRSNVSARLLVMFEGWVEQFEPAYRVADPFPPSFYTHLDVQGDERSEVEKTYTTEELVRQVLDEYCLSTKSDVSWRVKVLATIVALVLMRHSSDTATWLTLLQWAVQCLSQVSQLQLLHVCTHVLESGLKRFPDLAAQLPLSECHVLKTLAKVLPLQFRSEDISDKRESLWGIVDATNPLQMGHIWPSDWEGRFGTQFSVINALWWQTYFRAVRRTANAKNSVETSALTLAKLLSAEPAAEQIYHVAFIEMVAGALRAMRWEPTPILLSLWHALYPFLVTELQGAPRELVGEWEDGISFILVGVSRKPSSDVVGSPDAVRILLHFLSSKFEQVNAEEGTYFRYPADDSLSTFEKVKHIQLFKAVLEIPQCLAAANSERLWTSTVEGLLPLLEHPVKQLSCEAAETCILLIRHQHAPGLAPAARLVVDWIQCTAAELAVLLKADENKTSSEKKPPHVLKATGLALCIILALTCRCVHVDVVRTFDFLVTASSHDDTFLRKTASWALQFMCTKQHGLPEVPLQCFKYFTARMQATWAQLPTVGQKRALESCTVQLAANAFFLADTDMRWLMEFICSHAMTSSIPDVRHSACTALATCLLLDNRPAAAEEWLYAFATHSTPYPLICVLYTGCDLGVPWWVGKCIEALASYRSPEGKSVADIQLALQHFLRRLQTSHLLWSSCRQKLSVNHLELLNANKGNLFYFS